MKVFTDTLKGLVSRRLWPLAVLLLAALVATPFVLARSAAPAGSATASAPGSASADGATESLVSLDTTTGSRRRHVLGSAKDPFQPAPIPKAKRRHVETKAKAPAAEKVAPSPATGASPGASGTPAPSTGSGTDAPRPAKHTLGVRFGNAESDSLEASDLSALEALPSQDEPIAIFLGLEDHGKTAVFMLGDGVTVDGDGACAPSASECDTVRLHAGETEFFTVSGSSTLTDGVYQLDVVKIRK